MLLPIYLFLILDDLMAFCQATRYQLFDIPKKGNIYRPKMWHEINQTASPSFQDFCANCSTTLSTISGITHYYQNDTNLVYSLKDADNTICTYAVHMKHIIGPEKAAKLANPWFHTYFICDDTCCAMECCQRDLHMTLIGTVFIGSALLLLCIYIIVYVTGCALAWRSGSLVGKTYMSNERSSSKQATSETTLVVFKNGNCDNGL
ncbi:unnamed protein product [Auanema sp. JU1783]|nr:unnamed protein product [Auanema sp. JU1783]